MPHNLCGLVSNLRFRDDIGHPIFPREGHPSSRRGNLNRCPRWKSTQSWANKNWKLVCPASRSRVRNRIFDVTENSARLKRRHRQALGVQTGSVGQNLMTSESMICNPVTNFINWKPKNMLISHTLKHATKIHMKLHQVHVHLKSKIKLLDKYKLTFIIRQQNKSRLC